MDKAIFFSLILSILSVKCNAQNEDFVARDLKKIMRKFDTVVLYHYRSSWPQEFVTYIILGKKNHTAKLTYLHAVKNEKAKNPKQQISKYRESVKIKEASFDSVLVMFNKNNFWQLDREKLNDHTLNTDDLAIVRSVLFTDGQTDFYTLISGKNVVRVSTRDAQEYKEYPTLFNKERKTFIRCDSMFRGFYRRFLH